MTLSHRLKFLECRDAYAVGVRVQQALILLDAAEASRTKGDSDQFWIAAVRLEVVLEFLEGGLNPLEYALTVREARNWLLRVCSQLQRCMEQGSMPEPSRSPARPLLEYIRAAISYVLDSAAHDERPEDEEPYFSLQNWFQLGLTITSGTYDEESAEWKWDSWERLNGLLSSLRIDLSVVYTPIHPFQIIGTFGERRYPLKLLGWENVDFTLERLVRNLFQFFSKAVPDPAQAIPKPHRKDDAYEVRTTRTITETEHKPDLARTNEQAGPPFYAEDFRYVNWYGTEYKFTVNQACCVEVLWKAAEDKIPLLTQETILRKALNKHEGRLRDVFKLPGNRGQHPAWGTMIIPDGQRKGMYRLSKPVPPAAPGSSVD
jgi:hypothetical protein